MNDSHPILMMRYDAAKKSTLAAYWLAATLGFLGIHRFYLGKTSSAIGMLVLCLISFPLCLVIIGIFGYLALFIWWLIDLFHIGKWVQEYNEALISKFEATLDKNTTSSSSNSK